MSNPLWELNGEPPGARDHDDPLTAGRRSELFARYAVDLVKWLDVHVKKGGAETVEVFAPPRLLALLRLMYPASLAERVREHRWSFEGLTIHELERHPEVRAALEKDPERSSRRAS